MNIVAKVICNIFGCTMDLYTIYTQGSSVQYWKCRRCGRVIDKKKIQG